RRRDAAGEDDGVEVEDVLDAREHEAERVAHLVPHAARARVAFACRAREVFWFLRVAATKLLESREERGRPREGFDASTKAASAFRRVVAAIDRHVADLAAEAVRASAHLAIDHDAAADARAERHHQEARLAVTVHEVSERGGR